MWKEGCTGYPIVDAACESCGPKGGCTTGPVVSADESLVDMLGAEDVVRVSGVARELSVVEIEEELGLDLDDDLDVEYEDEHSIVASAIVVIDED